MAMQAFDILGDPVRCRILETLVDGEKASGEIVNVISKEFGITQPAVSHQLKVLRQSGFATVRPDAQRRMYSLESAPLRDVYEWLEPFSQVWDHKLDALATEVARGKKGRRR